MDITFYLADEPNLDKVKKFNPDKDWQKMKKGQRWTLQTYLRLLNAGYPVSISDEVPSKGIVIFNAKHKYQLKRSMNGHHKNIILVGVRGDKNEAYISDFELLQNGRWANGVDKFFIPYWGQPNLIRRDSTRGAKIENIAFKGFDINLHEYFFSLDWKNWLKENDLNWIHHSMPYAVSDKYGVTVGWDDYSTIDVVLAMRPQKLIDSSRLYSSKPGTKLYNAWNAGVPAVLGQEFAFRELRKSNLDYIEISSPEEAKEAILKLKGNPSLFEEMVQNGLKRSEEFSNEEILNMWVDFLYSKVPELVKTKNFLLNKFLPVPLKVSVKYLDRKLHKRPKK